MFEHPFVPQLATSPQPPSSLSQPFDHRPLRSHVMSLTNINHTQGKNLMIYDDALEGKICKNQTHSIHKPTTPFSMSFGRRGSNACKRTSERGTRAHNGLEQHGEAKLCRMSSTHTICLVQFRFHHFLSFSGRPIHSRKPPT